VSLIFQNEKEVKDITCADDISIINVGMNPKELKISPLIDTRQETQYFESNKLHINLNKANYILLQSKADMTLI
jgi:hypothetical protein